MNEVELNLFEKSIASDIKRIKPKTKQRGYARELVDKLYSVIEAALEDGCSYEEIATAILARKVKISPSTLKQYHQANRSLFEKNRENDNSELRNLPTSQDALKVKKTRKASLDNLKSSSVSNEASSSREHSQSKNKVVASKQSQSQQFFKPKETENVISLPQRLSGSSLSDEDYLDDFNDY